MLLIAPTLWLIYSTDICWDLWLKIRSCSFSKGKPQVSYKSVPILSGFRQTHIMNTQLSWNLNITASWKIHMCAHVFHKQEMLHYGDLYRLVGTKSWSLSCACLHTQYSSYQRSALPVVYMRLYLNVWVL